MKRFALVALIIMLAAPALAQYRTEFLVGGGGGVAPFLYTSQMGKTKMGISAGGDLSFAIMFNEYVGMKIGVGASYYNTNFSVQDATGKSRYWDEDVKDSMIYSYKIDNYSEKMTLIYGTVPVMLCVQTRGKNAFSFAAGVKIGLPIKASYTRNIDHFYATGNYYQKLLVTIDTPTFAGFGNFYGDLPPENIASIPDIKGSVKVGLMLNIAAEIGMKVKMRGRGFFYLLAYAEYGVLNTLDSKRELRDLIEWDAYTLRYFRTHSVSVLNGLTLDHDEKVPIVTKMTPLSFGLKIAFGIGMGKELGNAID